MVCVGNVNSLILEVLLIMVGVSHVMLNIFNKISKIGLVEIMILMCLFKMHNLKLKMIMKFWSGLIMIDLKMLNIWPRVFIKQIGKMGIYIVGILKIINGKGWETKLF